MDRTIRPTAAALATLTLAGCCHVPESQNGSAWQAYFFDHPNAEAKKTEVRFPMMPEPGKLADGRRVQPRTVEFTNGVLDLDQLGGGCSGAALVRRIRSDRRRKTWLGAGCRVFAVWLNGKLIYDFTAKGLGNDYDPVTSGDHIFALDLKKGDNELKIETCRTNWLLDYVYGKERKIRWRLALKELPDYQPVKAELAHPEFFSRPDIGSVLITFITRQPVPAAADYRLKGTEKWHRVWDLAGDLILREKSKIHTIRLTGLVPDAEYEYRPVLLEPPAGLDGFKRALWSKRPYREVTLPVRTFRTFGTTPEFRFFVLGDTQLSLSDGCKTVAQRSEFMRRMRALPAFRNADFVVHVGDLDSYAHDLEKTYFTDFFDHFSSSDSKEPVQWVYVRGNHELDGLGAEDWYDYFLAPGEKSYYAFRRGEVFFIVLDSGDFVKEQNGGYNGPILNLDTLFERQTRWLRALRRTQAFRSAKFRVVLAHVEPQIEQDVMSEKTRRMIAPLLADRSPEGRIHLWIGGHVHHYRRANRGSSDLISRQPVPKRAPGTAPVNWVTTDAPKGDSSKPEFSYLAVSVTPEEIQISALDENGREFDRYAVDTAGRVKELFRSPELKRFPLREK